MKLLLFSDLHCNEQQAADLVQRAQTADVVVGAGDFGNLRKGVEKTIAILQAIDRPAVLVCGNSESETELTDACKDWPSAHVLHGTSVEIDGQVFFGLGGAVPVTPFGSWSYDLTEGEARVLLENCPAGAVLVSHSPPYGVLDRSSSGQSIGSQAVREAIERTQPKLVVCGHIHACGGQVDRLDQTDVINAGPDGVEWEL